MRTKVKEEENCMEKGIHTYPRAEPAMLTHRMEEIGPHFGALVQRTQRPRLLRALSTTGTRGRGRARTRTGTC